MSRETHSGYETTTVHLVVCRAPVFLVNGQSEVSYCPTVETRGQPPLVCRKETYYNQHSISLACKLGVEALWRKRYWNTYQQHFGGHCQVADKYMTWQQLEAFFQLLVFVVWLPQCQESMIQQVKTKKRRHWRFVLSPSIVFFERLILSPMSGVYRCSQKPSIEFVSQCQGAFAILFCIRDNLKMWCQQIAKSFHLWVLFFFFFLCCPHMYKTRRFLRHSAVFSHMSLMPQSGFFNAPNTHLAFGAAEDGVHSPFKLCWTEKQEIRNKVLRRRSRCGQRHNCSRTAR